MQREAVPRPEPREILERSRRDRSAALRDLGALAPESQAELVCETPIALRRELLELLPFPEEVIPLLPEAELCFTVKQIGLGDAAWILESATAEQMVASLDLDVWQGTAPDRQGLAHWIEALADTSDEAFYRTLHALDPELLVIHLQSRLRCELQPSDDEAWQPPEGSQTLDGQFHFVPLVERDEVTDIVTMLRVLFERDYWSYFRMMQAIIWELPSENEEWALRWRTGRLEDLGFPPWDEAMRLYAYVRPNDLAAVPDDAKALDVGEWRLPVWMPALPDVGGARPLLFRTVAELEPEERRAAFYAFVAVANAVAVADRMPLGDAESTPRSIAKAARFVSDGLEHVAAERGLEATEVLRRVPMERLFRVGANLDPEAAKPRP